LSVNWHNTSLFTRKAGILKRGIFYDLHASNYTVLLQLQINIRVQCDIVLYRIQ
jgi:hypothetical protein